MSDAKRLKALHAPSSPLILTNIWDIASFNTVAALNSGTSRPVKAVATASWAVAAMLGLKDEELTLEQNLEAVAKIAPLARAAGLPLSTDLQDGYGSHIASVVKRAVELGVSGANIEDTVPATGNFYPTYEQAQRLQTALEAAAAAGCPDFVINARCDIFHFDTGLDEQATLEEAIARGKAYLDAGATTVFYWGGGRPLRTAWVERLVKELGGRVAVLLKGSPDGLTTAELAEIGVARISIGPTLFVVAKKAMQEAAEKILTGASYSS